MDQNHSHNSFVNKNLFGKNHSSIIQNLRKLADELEADPNLVLVGVNVEVKGLNFDNLSRETDIAQEFINQMKNGYAAYERHTLFVILYEMYLHNIVIPAADARCFIRGLTGTLVYMDLDQTIYNTSYATDYIYSIMASNWSLIRINHELGRQGIHIALQEDSDGNISIIDPFSCHNKDE